MGTFQRTPPLIFVGVQAKEMVHQQSLEQQRMDGED
jgi:hypothetical protein